jgi:hypothetical protein
VSKLKLLSVRRPGIGGVIGKIGPKSQSSGVTGNGASAGAATATCGGGEGGGGEGGGATNATGGGAGGGGAATSAGGGGQAQEAVAISNAETIRMRTRSPVLGPIPQRGGRGSFPYAASCPAEEVLGPLPIIRAAGDLLHQFRRRDTG